MDPVIRAEMAMLIQREKKATEELEALREELGLWRRRVELALEKGMVELAEQADARVEEIRTKGRAVRHELEVIEMDKSMLLEQSRRSRGPTGQEVARAEALLDSFRESGLVDPDEAMLEREIRDLQSQLDVERLKREDD
jgi:phage shock protein A